MTLNATSARPPRNLSWDDMPAKAQRLANELGLTEAGWFGWIGQQPELLRKRVDAGSAEHVAYFLIHARSFRDLAPVERRTRFLSSSIHSRHAAVLKLYRSIESEWSIERCIEHANAFQLANRDLAARESLYHRRGLSSDCAPQDILTKLPAGLNPAKILIAGPGLDLTRREPFDDDAPVVSHQYEALRKRYPRAAITCVDVRPEVLETLHAARMDVTTQVLSDVNFDLIVATNLLLYFEDRELLTALAGFAAMLAPSGRLLHNDTRFAAKVFGEAMAMPVERYEAVQWDARRWDRAVIHRKVSSS
jgi:hypothetical protein